MSKKLPILIIRHVLFLLERESSYSYISSEVGVSKGYISKVHYRIVSLHLTAKEVLAMTDAEINQLIYPPTEKQKAKVEPDWYWVDDCLKHGMTRLACYEEYCLKLKPMQKPFAYSSFCQKFKKWWCFN